MLRARAFLMRTVSASIAMVAALGAAPARAADEFPFGLEMTLDVARQPGSKRLPTLEIGDNGEAVLELWCKGGKRASFRWPAIP
jgi:hypothetical protein